MFINGQKEEIGARILRGEMVRLTARDNSLEGDEANMLLVKLGQVGHKDGVRCNIYPDTTKRGCDVKMEFAVIPKQHRSYIISVLEQSPLILKTTPNQQTAPDLP